MKMEKAQTIQASEPLSKAISVIEKTGQSVIVLDGSKYVGIIDERQLQAAKGDAAKTKCSTIAVKAPALSPVLTPVEICKAFFAGRFKTLPIMEGTKILGTMGRHDLLNMLENEGELKGLKVSQFMTSPIITVDAAASVSTARALMKEANVRRLAVIENGHLTGLISVFDLLKSLEKSKSRHYQNASGLEGIVAPVSSFMKSEIHTIAPASSLSEAVEKMIDERVSALVVVDGKRPVGILTAKDIFQAMMHEDEGIKVFVSGLRAEDKMLSEDIASEGARLLEKIGPSIGATSLDFHLKQVGGEYFVSGHIHGDNMVRATATAFDIMEAVHTVLDSLKTQGLKHKKTGMQKRKNR